LRLSLGWLKPPVPLSSDVAVEPAILQESGEVTSPSPGPGGGGVPRHVSGERESSLADPHGGPAATDLSQRKIIIPNLQDPLQIYAGT
jgi:hypothetical protein